MSAQQMKREKVSATSGDVLEAQIAKLRSLFPEAFVEGKIDFDKLKATLGAATESGPNRFSFTWAGKDDALSLLQTPSRGTLIPCPEESVNYETTGNVFIEGDNLEVLKLLFKPYFGRVKLIYIDPPYNTGNDFVYPDNYADPLKNYLIQTKQIDDDGNLTTSKIDRTGRIHSGWLSMMYPRLFLARQLLCEDGVICVSLDDNEIHHLRMLMNEVFGEKNFVATVLWQKVYSPKNSAKHLSEDHDYIVIFARNAETWRPTLLPRTEEANARYENSDNDPRGDWKSGDMTARNYYADGQSEEANARYENSDNDPRGDWKSGDMTARNYYADGQYEVASPSGKKFTPPRGRYWVVNQARFSELDADNRIWWGETGNNMPALKRFLTEVKQGMVPQTMWFYEEVGHTQEAKKELLEFVKYEDTDNVLDTVKPTRLLKRVLQLCTTPADSDLVVDFFAGSCSTAHAVLSQNRDDGGNRQFICVQLPEKLPKPEKELKLLTDVGKQRLRNVIKHIKESQDTFVSTERTGPEDLGFKVFKLATPNIEPWVPEADRDPDSYARKLGLFNDPLVSGWTAGNVLWEIALREGFGLNTRFAEKKFGNGSVIHELTDPDKDPPQRILVCLDDEVRADLSKHCPLTADTLLICRDKALDDSAAANLALQCRLKTI